MNKNERKIMELIANSGDARSKALEALKASTEHRFDEAEELMSKCNIKIKDAHRIQTETIQDEVRGESTEITLLMVHAQDHLMDAMTIRDLVLQLMEGYRKEKQLEERVNNLERSEG